jgi:hypothetical protein
MLSRPHRSSAPALDGSLLDWRDVEDEYEWDALLVGNGLSINVWAPFAYRALFDYAKGGGLTAEDLALFDGTPNFERVLADLNTTIRVCQVAGVDTATFYDRYRRIQLALGHAIRAVHLGRWEVPDTTLETIRDELLQYEWVFTTSYDLIVYWAMGAGPNGRFTPFADLFRWANRCQFDPDRSEVPADVIPVYFVHGALHLVVGGDGETWKLRRNLIQNLLDQFGQPTAGDPQARPLLVTEGSARDKVRAIEGNDYLSHALDRLRARDLPVVVFGSSLSREDQHLVDALNEHERPVAVSMYPSGKREVATLQADIHARLDGAPLIFFDSTTHPLGSTALRVER